MPMTDAHHHLWSHQRYTYGWIKPGVGRLGDDFLPAQLDAVAGPTGVTRAVLVQTFHSLDETRWFLSLAAASSRIAGVVGWVDLTSPTLRATLDELASDPGFKGVRHGVQSDPNADWLSRTDVLQGLEALAARGLTFDLLIKPMHLKQVPALAKRVPGLRMVIDHMAKPAIARREWQPWADDLAAVGEFSQVFCKISGLVTEAGAGWQAADLQDWIDHAVACFSPRRCMFGSDWPVCLLASDYAQTLGATRACLASLPPADQEAILHDTAGAFYRLEP